MKNEKGIKKTIGILRNLDIDDDIIAEQVADEFEVNSEEVQLFLWDFTPATEEFINEVYTMWNLGQGIEDNGVKKGIKKAINIMRDLDIDDDIIAEKVEEEFELSSEEVQLFF